MKNHRSVHGWIGKTFLHRLGAGFLVFALAAQSPAGQDTKPEATSQRPLIANLVNPPPYTMFPFLSWEKKVTPVADGLHVMAPNGQGGFTLNCGSNLSAFAEWTPRLTLTAGPSNATKALNLSLTFAAATNQYSFKLDGLMANSTLTVLATDGASLREPGAGSNPGVTSNLNGLTQLSIVGTWLADPVDLTITRLDLVPPDDAMRKARDAMRMRLAREADNKRKAAEAEAKRKADLLAVGASHFTNGAAVRNVGAVASDILGIEIQEKEYIRGAMLPYTAQPNDTRIGGKLQWIVRDGKLVQELQGQTIQRKDAKGTLAKLGTLCSDGKWVLVNDNVGGAELEKSTLEEPTAYAIQSSDDPAFTTPVTPLAVYRKSKPNSPPSATGGIAIQHRLYLKLPSTLQEGATYTVRFKGVNTREASVSYKHDTRFVRSDAIHVTQIGYRPDDPFKRGYLSLWLGTGGGYAYAGIDTFELVDAQSGKTVFKGKVELGKSFTASNPAQLSNYAMTTAYWLDFSAFRTPGNYRVRIPGIGVSYPFPIADTSWDGAFKIGMRGVLAQRAGIALGPPFLDYKRPRPSHPDDGVKFYQTDIVITNGQEGPRGDALLRLWKATGKLDEVTGIWGGYQDAGDWDTYLTTLMTADELTEAFEINGDYAKHVKLTLPPEEMVNKIPNLLTEALWGLAAFKRLQLPNGAVRDGYGDAWGCYEGTLSWNDSNPVCVYAPSTDSSWRYASIAARVARLLAPYDAAQARAYGESAIRAWKWAEAQNTVGAAPSDADRQNGKWLQAHALEAAAAVALYQFTRESAYHERFKQVCEILEDRSTDYAGGGIEPLQQPDADFFYARLPDDLADPVLKKHALNLYILAGNVAVYFMQHNEFNLASVYPGMPMVGCCAFFTNPGMGVNIVRAHALTHDARVLEAVIASTGFGHGANPDNMVYTTGLGVNSIHFPLKVDALRTGQPAPAGITVYGPNLQRPGGWEAWVHSWVLTPARMVPNSYTWPPSEMYADVYSWVGANEFCVHSPLTSAAYVWCYLAARQ